MLAFKKIIRKKVKKNIQFIKKMSSGYYGSSAFIEDEISSHNEIYNEQIKKNKINTFRCPICFRICNINLSYTDKNVVIKYKCENGHEKQLNLESFIKETREFNIYSAICSQNASHYSEEFIFCFDCGKFYCEHCISKNHSNHKNIKVSQFDSTCSLHVKKYEGFCENCQKNICRDCKTEHIRHTIFNIYPIEKNVIDKLTSDLNSSKKFLDDVKQKFNEVKKEIEEKLNYIQSSFNKFHQINIDEITLFETLIKTYQDNYMNNLNYTMIKNIRSTIDINRFEIDLANTNDLGRKIKNLIDYLENTNNYILKSQVQFNFNKFVIKQESFILSGIPLKDGRFVTSNTNGSVIIYNSKNYNEEFKIKIKGQVINGIENEYGMCLNQINDILLVGTNKGKINVFIIKENTYTELEGISFNEKVRIYKLLNIENNQVLACMESGHIYTLKLNNDSNFAVSNFFNTQSNLINALYLSNNKFCVLSIENRIKKISFYDLNGNLISEITNISASTWIGNSVKIDNNTIGIVGAKITLIDTNNYLIIGEPQSSKNYMTLFKMRNGDYLAGGINNLLCFTIANNKYVQKFYFEEVFEDKTSKITQIFDINGKIILCSSNGEIKILE